MTTGQIVLILFIVLMIAPGYLYLLSKMIGGGFTAGSLLTRHRFKIRQRQEHGNNGRPQA